MQQDSALSTQLKHSINEAQQNSIQHNELNCVTRHKWHWAGWHLTKWTILRHSGLTVLGITTQIISSLVIMYFITTTLRIANSMAQHTLKSVNNYFNTNIDSYLETSEGQSFNLYLNLVHFLTPELIRHLWQLKTIVLLHRCLIYTVLLRPSHGPSA